jgi:catechol 2,3-dioxygenase-like lactoylglutathione lyase family enzyme
MEDMMASTDVGSSTATATPGAAPVDLGLEVVTVPVSDVDRAKAFYEGLGWRLDADIVVGDAFRVVQFTPPNSNASIHFGIGLTKSPPGAVDRMILAVENIDAARADLISRGADVGEVYRSDGKPVPSPGEERGTYLLYASFTDPDGNGYFLQEITTRLPGRVWEKEGDVAALADLLHETAEHHDAFEKATPPHNWWDWYAAYFNARQQGSTSEDAVAAAGRYMAEVKHIVASSS